MLLAVEYPSRAAFVKMAMNPEYLKVHAHRVAALSVAGLIASTPAPM
jgi:hypothetical protein